MNRTPHLLLIATLILCESFVSSAASGETPGADRPNVVLIMTDDQGYGDLSITGNQDIETPNMDRIAHEGAWLKQFYVSPVCTPTRAHLMTGRYAYRTRAIDTFLGRAVMEPDEFTVAEALSGAGYQTGIFGKWHLGDYYPTRPVDQGFTESLVHQGGGLRQPANPPDGERYHDPILFRNGDPQRYEGFCTDIFFDEAGKFIEKQVEADEPFFVYLPTNAPHGPFDEAPSRELFEHFKEKFPDHRARPGFYSMIKNVDDNIGRLLELLDRTGAADNTLVIFMTDNGPAGGGSAGPFRANKGSVYQGGIRTVCFFRLPGKIAAGTTSEKTTAHLDLMPTILDYCNAPLPDRVQLDGRSVRGLIEPAMDEPVEWPDRSLFLQWHRGDEPQRYHHFAAVGPQGRWKLVNAATQPARYQMENPPVFELFDLVNDIGETKDVAAENPEIIDRLKAEYDAWFDDVCNTRDPNFGMPPIVIGAPQQKTVVLTPQDKRADSPAAGGWQATGSWPVDIRETGPYTIEFRLSREARQKRTIRFTIDCGDSMMTKRITVHRGAQVAVIGEVDLPSTGTARIVARVEEDGQVPDQRDKATPWVYQITIK